MRKFTFLLLFLAAGCMTAEEPPGGPDKGMAFAVLGVSRLLANQHDLRGSFSLAEHGLGADHPQPAATTGARRLPQRPQCASRRDEISGTARDEGELGPRCHAQRLSPSCGIRACAMTFSSTRPRWISRIASTFSLFFSASSCCSRS